MAEHRYWRVNIRSNQYGGYPSLCEVSMADMAGGANLLTGGTATANAQADGAILNAIDGNPDNWWGAGNVFPSWWAYDFGRAVIVVEVKITARRDTVPGATTAPKDWDLQYSDDGIAWFTQNTFLSANWTQGMVQTFASTAGPGVPGDVRVSQAGLMALGSSASIVRVSQAGLMVLTPNAAPIADAMIQIIG